MQESVAKVLESDTQKYSANTNLKLIVKINS